MKRYSPLLLVAALAGLAGCETQPYYADVQVRGDDFDARVVFSDHDRAVIREYYGDHYRSLPPGLAKKGKVPPGHAYKLRRQEGIPPGVTWEYLPPEVERRLSRLPEGYAHIVIGSDVAILNSRTRVVLDVVGGNAD
jgi:hypothetical protein